MYWRGNRKEYTVDTRTSNGLMFEQFETRIKFEENLVLKLEQNLEVEQRITWSSRLVKKWRPNIAVVNRGINLFNDNVMQYFRKKFKK
jgi:hypothetical protein